MVSGVDTIRSGLPIAHSYAFSNAGVGGMSAGLPFGAPPSTHFTIVAICSSLSDGSSLNFWMPTLRSMNHGGISRCEIFVLMDRAHGRASSYVVSDIGAIDPGRW